MHLTLHLTSECNLRCKYCYVEKRNAVMNEETAFKAVELALQSPGPTGLVFFGGEPLLKKELIKKIVSYSAARSKETSHRFYYKITTNGTLLDEDFLHFTKCAGMVVGFSHDGLAQDDCRVFPNGGGTFGALEEKMALLLKYQPYAVAMSTFTPETVSKLSSSVEFLFEKGFRYLIPSLNYAADATWTERALAELKKQYERLAKDYIEWTLSGEKFYLGMFEMKILSRLRGENYCSDRCQLGKKQISVAPDGKLYPCVQFVGDDEYVMGDVETGVDPVLRSKIWEKGAKDSPECEACAIRLRCNHTCGCLNRQATGYVDRVSPVQCENEKMLIRIADRVAEALYRKRNPLFIHKHYDKFYPILSLVEDRARKYK